MNRVARHSSHPQIWSYIVIILVGLGVLFRVAELGQPVYWVDEVATSMRVSGYTQAEVVAQVATGQPLTVADLQRFQRIRRDSPPERHHPLANLFRVLAQSPEHAPLYFVLARFWAEIFGGSPAAMRSLSVVFSLLSLPVMYALGHSLQKQALTGDSSGAALMGESAIALLAISPFFVAYAQEARPYSLWTLLLLLVNLFLWRSLQSRPSLNGRTRWQDWLAYTFALTLCLYTSLLTVLIVCGQSLVVLGFQARRYQKVRLPYILTTGAALLALSPWIWIIVSRWQTLQSNTVWMQTSTTIWAILGTWFYSLAVLFFDVPVASNPIVFVIQVVIATVTLAFMGYAAYVFIRRGNRAAVGLALASSLSVPLLLLLLDLLRDGQAAATPRYLMPAHLGVLIALAYLLRDRLLHPSRRWHSLIALFLCVGLISCVIGIGKSSPYQKSRNLSNAGIVAVLNAEKAPQLVTTPYYIQDTISLSYRLNPDIYFYILPSEDNVELWLSDILKSDRPTFFFTPSEETKAAIRTDRVVLESVFQPAPLISGKYGLTLWRISRDGKKISISSGCGRSNQCISFSSGLIEWDCRNRFDQ